MTYWLSRALAAKASAAAAIVLDVLGFVAGLEEPGFKGRGGGARSGSELSHLDLKSRIVSFIKYKTPPLRDSSLSQLFGKGSEKDRGVHGYGSPRVRN